MVKSSSDTHPKLTAIVLISGNGSNLQAIIDACRGGLAIDLLAVISDNAGAYGLVRAKTAGLNTHVIAPESYENQQQWQRSLLNMMQLYRPDLVVCAGFMRILDASVVAAFRHRIINVHPSLLPKYPGLRTHQRVLAHGDARHGTTVHLVTEALDAGPMLAQSSLAVAPGDTEQTLDNKIKYLEHKLLPEVLAWYATGQLSPGQAPIKNDQTQKASHKD